MSGAAPTPPPRPWSGAADLLLTDVLLGCPRMLRHDFRQQLVAAMGRSAATPGIDADITEHGRPSTHVRNLVEAVAARADPRTALESLCDALRALAPDDAALPWLDLTALLLTRDPEPHTGELPSVVAELFRLPALPGLHRHVPGNTSGLRNLTGEESLPELLGRLVDRRDPDVLGPLTGFLRALGADPCVTRHAELPALRRFVDAFGGPAPAAAPQVRLIIQIRLDEETPEHTGDTRYRLRLSYYRQPLAGGPFERADRLPVIASLTRSELAAAGAAALVHWPALEREIRGKAVRIEFLLPRSMLSHAAELWSSGSTGRPIGQHHPVVVRSLERYTDKFVNFEAWHARWDQLGGLVAGDGRADPLDRIGWPPLDPARVADLPDWLAARPALACLGLDVPYDQLHADVRYAVDDAMYLDGLPGLLWRRVAGDADVLVEALREHRPARLADLPDTVHRYRRKLRARTRDPRHDVTLLWEDPDCVDPDQDSPFPGMAG
ncbi:hypothetical protein ACFXAF_34175 [Kitasatospora sp. NPDC059463]|uniref:VMAP-C domain-containing protein n=1 Tax=unclassified Kitasatospora TaxID=2633591 RepID=UPI0036A2DEDA